RGTVGRGRPGRGHRPAPAGADPMAAADAGLSPVSLAQYIPRMTLKPGWTRSAAVALLAAAMVSCGPAPAVGMRRLWSGSVEIRPVADVRPPRALERITYTAVIIDKNTREPIANGEGRIFATNSSRKTVHNGFTYGPEVGTYRTTLMFV